MKQGPPSQRLHESQEIDEIQMLPMQVSNEDLDKFSSNRNKKSLLKKEQA